jgi:hypothetical protein
MYAPMLDPATQSTSIPFSSSTWITPMCAADAAASDLTRETPNMEVEPAVTAHAVRRKSERERMHRLAQPRDQFPEFPAGHPLVRDDDWLHVVAGSARLFRELLHEERKIVEGSRSRLHEDVGEVRLDEAFERRAHRRRGCDVEHHVVVVPAAVAEQRRHRGRGG